MIEEKGVDSLSENLSAANSAFAILIRPEASVYMLMNSMFVVEPNLNPEFEFTANYNELIQKIIPDFIDKSSRPLSPEDRKTCIRQAYSNLTSLHPFVVMKGKEGIQVKAVEEDITIEDLYEKETTADIDSTSTAFLDQIEEERRSSRFSKVRATADFASNFTKSINNWFKDIAAGQKEEKEEKESKKGSRMKRN